MTPCILQCGASSLTGQPAPAEAGGTNAHIYDGENRLVSATAAGVTATLTYDPLGRLWQLVKPGTSDTRFLYDGDALVAEYNSAGTLAQRYTHGSNLAADDPLIWYDGGATKRYLHADHLGSIVAATNAAISAPAINTYDEYGVPGAGNVGRFQYTGQIWLGELGLYHYKARLYSPRLGRFLQTDPVGYKDQINLYAYVGDDPMNLMDPSGQRQLTGGEVKMLQSVFGSSIHLLPVFDIFFVGRSMTTPVEVDFGPTAYSGDFAKEASEYKVNTFWHEFYHVFENSIGAQSWISMAFAHVAANPPDRFFGSNREDNKLYDWQPGKSFNQQGFEARANAFGACMSGGGCSHLEGMRVQGNGTSLSFKGGEFTLKETITGSRIPQITHFKPPECTQKDKCQ